MNWKAIGQWIEEVLQQIVYGDKMDTVTYDYSVKTPPVAPDLPPTASLVAKPPLMPTPKTTQLYTLSKSLIGKHLSLNDNVPWMVGCAEAVSNLLQQFHITGIPHQGIEGTAELLQFLCESKQFQEIYTYTPGAILIAATGTGNGKIRGHVGVCGNNSIMSNNSESGKWETAWNYERWNNYYTVYGGIPTRYFLPV